MIGVLFDIDGTLIDTQGQGGAAFVRSIQEVWQLDHDLSWITFSGATDLDVLDRIARRCGIETTVDRVAEFFSCYADHLRSSLDPEQVRVLPHAYPVLEALASDANIRLGLVTGNARETAFLKLASVGLDHFFNEGGFGDEDAVRATLVRHAMGRVGDCQHYTVVGDTPNDMNAAASCDILPIGIATGLYSEADLAACHPQAEVLPNLEKLHHVLQGAF